MKENKNTNMIVTIAFLIALEIILTRFLSINLPYLRMGFGFLPVAMIGILYGPLWAGAAYALGDILGMMIFPTGPYFPGFTVSAFLTGVTFGFFLYNRTVTWKKVVIPSAIVLLIINLGIDTYWLTILLGKGYLALLPARIIKTVLAFPIQVTLIPFVYNRLLRKIPFFQTA
jgi:ECF transporter S component (folate family)